jgi:hypothetical protein
MSVNLLIILFKTFYFLRIFKSLSFLYSMLKQVFRDLVPFLTFFGIMCIVFGMLLSVLDWGNYEFQDDPAIRLVQFTSTGPDKEYLEMNKFFARIVAILRIAMGDFDFNVVSYMTPA